jgi:DNA-binding transcriptional regulator YdaS (Cro superfamily)
MKSELIAKVVKHYGSQRALARAMCVTEGAVSHWVKNGAIPSDRAIRIETAMRGRVKAAQLVKLVK